MSKQRSLRKSRALDEDDDNAGGGGALGAAPAAVRAAQLKREKQRKGGDKPALLSFDDDAGDDADGAGGGAAAPPPGRARASLRAPAPPVQPPAAPAYSHAAPAGEYTAERLAVLRAGTRRAPVAPPAAQPPAAAGFALTGSFRAGAAPADDRFCLDAAGLVGGGAMPLPPPAGPPPGEEGSESEDGGDIPDDATIRRARERREALRTGRQAPDYIAVGGSASGARPPGAASAGSGSDAEPEAGDGARLAFGVGGAAGPGAAAAAAVAAGEGGGAQRRWAEEQMRKGMGAGAARAVPPPRAAPRPGSVAAAEEAELEAAAAEVVGALRAALRRARLSQKQAETNLERTRRGAAEAVEAAACGERALEAAGGAYAAAQRRRAWAADLCAMLAEKAPVAEELEEELATARAARAGAAAARAAAAAAEDAAPAAAAADAALRALAAGADGAAVAAAAAAAEAEAEARVAGGALVPVELDEFGRDANAGVRAAAGARAARRAAARAAAAADYAAAAAPGAPAPALGDATTSESEGETRRFDSRAGEIRDLGARLFADAADEYGSVAALRAALEAWHRERPGAYRDAYAALSAPALFAPFVRAQLLGWAPLGGEAGAAPRFAALPWYEQLFDFGAAVEEDAGADGGGAPGSADPDGDLVPRLLSALAAPAAERALRECWRPWSARAGGAAAGALRDLAAHLPPDSAPLARAMEAARARLAAAAAEAEPPAWPAAALAASRRAEAHAAWRFGRTLRLLRSAAAFDGVLPPEWLRPLALEALVGRALLPHARAAAADPLRLSARLARIVAALPPAWLAAGAPRGAEGLAELAELAARQLEGQAGAAGAAAAAERACAVLRALGNAATAERLAAAHGLR
jgi:GC-rich sequence DNA-binding factor